MTSQKIIERLLEKNWFIEVKNDHELALVFNACIDANITWRGNESIINFDLLDAEKECGVSVKVIYFEENADGITWNSEVSLTGEENFTDWFFEEIKNDEILCRKRRARTCSFYVTCKNAGL